MPAVTPQGGIPMLWPVAWAQEMAQQTGDRREMLEFDDIDPSQFDVDLPQYDHIDDLRLEANDLLPIDEIASAQPEDNAPQGGDSVANTGGDDSHADPQQRDILHFDFIDPAQFDIGFSESPDIGVLPIEDGEGLPIDAAAASSADAGIDIPDVHPLREILDFSGLYPLNRFEPAAAAPGPDAIAAPSNAMASVSPIPEPAATPQRKRAAPEAGKSGNPKRSRKAATARACAAAKAATDAFALKLMEGVRTLIVGRDSWIGLEVVGLHNIPVLPGNDGKRIRLTFTQATAGSDIVAKVKLIDPSTPIGTAYPTFELTHKTSKRIEGRRALYSEFLIATACEVRAWLRPSPVVPFDSALSEMRKIRQGIDPSMTDTQFERQMHAFKPVLGDGIPPSVPERDEVSDAPKVFVAWQKLCTAHLNAAVRQKSVEFAPGYKVSVSGLAGMEDQPMPRDADAHRLHYKFWREPGGVIKVRIFINRMGRGNEILGESVLYTPQTRKKKEANISSLMARATVAAKALLGNEAPPAESDVAKRAQRLHDYLPRTSAWPFHDVDLWIALSGFTPVLETPASDSLARSTIVSAGWQEIAGHSRTAIGS